MEWSDIGKTVASAAPLLGGALGGPLGAAAGSLISSFFGVDDTPEAVDEAIRKDPNAIIKLKQIESDNFKERGETLRAMLESDAKNQHTTRPKIAYQAFQIVGAVALICISIWAYAVISMNVDMVQMVMNGWPFVAAIIAPLTGLLYAYFGILRKERNDGIKAAGGNFSAGIIGSVINRITK